MIRIFKPENIGQYTFRNVHKIALFFFSKTMSFNDNTNKIVKNMVSNNMLVLFVRSSTITGFIQREH